MCTTVAVDPVAYEFCLQKIVANQVEQRPFYCEFAMQMTEVCMATVMANGNALQSKRAHPKSCKKHRNSRLTFLAHKRNS
ncbi:hypothetical protein T01_4027 [Trichinella spiralis]|uniref:Uncharacterized protein n=1 Tax=Trichinella spiralis TaxID=6334 RepID=A0A0V1B1R2_TRISP|nr:hypothetical protein T01_4027 [Trichinella spiralis]